jgi:hypothetical protein
MDSLQLIKNCDIDFHHYGFIIMDIRSLLLKEWEVQLRHTLREGNCCADFLAKLGVKIGWSFILGMIPLQGYPLFNLLTLWTFVSVEVLSFCFLFPMYQKKTLYIGMNVVITSLNLWGTLIECLYHGQKMYITNKMTEVFSSEKKN